MTEAPDLIFWNQQFNHHNHVSTGHFAGGTSYTRTDLAEARIAALEAENERLRGQRSADLNAGVYVGATVSRTRVEALEAENKELRAVLQGIIDLGGTMGSALYAKTVDRAARRALEGGE